MCDRGKNKLAKYKQPEIEKVKSELKKIRKM